MAEDHPIVAMNWKIYQIASNSHGLNFLPSATVQGAPLMTSLPTGTTIRRRNVGSSTSEQDEKASSSSEQALAPISIPKDTALFHGTKSDTKWWETSNPYPNKDGEDGGVSFALDPDATSKIRTAEWVLCYKAKIDFIATKHASKSTFYSYLNAHKTECCYTTTETELVMKAAQCSTYLTFVKAVPATSLQGGGTLLKKLENAQADEDSGWCAIM